MGSLGSSERLRVANHTLMWRNTHQSLAMNCQFYFFFRRPVASRANNRRADSASTMRLSSLSNFFQALIFTLGAAAADADIVGKFANANARVFG